MYSWGLLHRRDRDRDEDADGWDIWGWVDCVDCVGYWDCFSYADSFDIYDYTWFMSMS